MVVISALFGAAVAGGFWLVILGFRRQVRPEKPKSLTWSWRSPLVRVLGLALVGAAIGLLTGWVIAIVVLPVVGLGLPYLVGPTRGASDIARLEAMEEWTRALAGILTAGAGLEQALVATLRSTPPAIEPEVTRLVARLRARWPTPAAIRAFADDLDDPTGDIIAANLLLSASRRGTGLSSVLEGLAESVAFDVRARRQVEADRAKPRSTARWVTVISASVLVVLALSGNYVKPYSSPIGQVILVVLLAAYVATLVWMRRMATGKPLPRFLDRRTELSPGSGVAP